MNCFNRRLWLFQRKKKRPGARWAAVRVGRVFLRQETTRLGTPWDVERRKDCSGNNEKHREMLRALVKDGRHKKTADLDGSSIPVVWTYQYNQTNQAQWSYLSTICFVAVFETEELQIKKIKKKANSSQTKQKNIVRHDSFKLCGKKSHRRHVKREETRS